MIEYDENFNNSFDFCAEEMHEEGLDWAYESSKHAPINLIASGTIEKSRISLDLPTFLSVKVLLSEFFKYCQKPLGVLSERD